MAACGHRADVGFDWLMSETRDKKALLAQREALLESFRKTPLAQMQPEKEESLDVLLPLAVACVEAADELLFG